MVELLGRRARMLRLFAECPFEAFERAIKNLAIKYEFGWEMMEERGFAESNGGRDLAHPNPGVSAGGKERLPHLEDLLPAARSGRRPNSPIL